MNTVLENLTNIVNIKNELRAILKAVGMNPTDNFEEYPQLFTAALEQLNENANIILGE